MGHRVVERHSRQSQPQQQLSEKDRRCLFLRLKAMACARLRSLSSAIESLTPLPFGREIHGFSVPMAMTPVSNLMNSVILPVDRSILTVSLTLMAGSGYRIVRASCVTKNGIPPL